MFLVDEARPPMAKALQRLCPEANMVFFTSEVFASGVEEKSFPSEKAELKASLRSTRLLIRFANEFAPLTGGNWETFLEMTPGVAIEGQAPQVFRYNVDSEAFFKKCVERFHGKSLKI